MGIGVSFPHQAMGTDGVAIRDWAQAAEDLGFDHIVTYDHVISPTPPPIPARHSAIATRSPCTSRWFWADPCGGYPAHRSPDRHSNPAAA